MTEDQKAREEFEAWFQDHDYDRTEYPVRFHTWQAAWQASRRTYRASVLEEAAKVCEDISDEYGDREGGKWPELKSDAQSGAKACENDLRALAAKTQEGQ